jgi:PAS domain S-box-containing protein
MLRAHGFSCHQYQDVHELCAGIANGVGAIVLTEEALIPRAMEELDAVFRGQTPWSDIGLILLTSNAARVQGAVHARLQHAEKRSIILIERPVRLPTLASTVASVLQSRKRQYEIREYLEERARNEARYRTLFTSIDQGFCVIDVLFDGNGVACDYRFIEVNPAFEKQTGLVGAIGKTVRELVPDHEPHWFEIYGRIALTGVSERFERGAQALGHFYEVFAFRIGAPEDRRLAVLFNDIGERKRAEFELRESEARQAFLLNLNDALRSLADPREIQFEATRRLGEHLGADRVGYAECEGDGESIIIHRHYTYGVAGVEGRHHLKDYGATLHSELLSGRAVVRADIANDPGLTDREKAAFAALRVGAMADFPLVKAGRLVAILFIHHVEAHAFGASEVSLLEAVAERTWSAVVRARAEEALRASEARERARAAELLAILDAAPIAMFIAQDPEGRKMVGNRMTYEALRLPPGTNVSKSAPTDDAPATFRAMRDGREIPPEDLPAQRAAATGRPVRNYEFDIVYEDGTCRNMLGEAVPLFDEHGQPRGAVGAFVDITERKQNEERLRQTQKLESVGVLAGGIAHDFNNLLTGIMGNASLVLDDIGPGPAELIREVISGAERAANLTRQLLAYSGQGQFVVRDLDVSEAVNEIRGLVEFSIPRSVKLSVTVQSRLPIVRMDPSQLQQILMNLVINAGEAIGEGNPGEINVATSMTDIDRPFVDAVGSEVAPGRYVCIEVRDTGPGIGENEKWKIFDPFFTTKFTGRGLGLAAVAGILRSRMGGITLRSAPGQGTIFRVFLPAAEKRALPGGEASGRERLGTILVVDDDASVRHFIGAVLRKQGYRVLLASDGREALAAFERETGTIDGIVLDVVMPVMGANELLPNLKKRQPNVRVLLTSGYSETEARRLCAAYPGAAFIQKPYTAQQIARAVAQIVGISN